jgi:hypothetical protein
MPASELDRIDPEGEVIALEDGTKVRVVRLRTRQFFRLMKVLTHGGGQAFIQALDFNAPGEEFMQRLLTAILFSIPDAEAEAVNFIQSMCRPPDVAAPETERVSQEKADADDAKYAALHRQMFNPPLEDTVSVIEQVIKQEAGDIQALGKRLAGLLKLAERTGQLKPGKAEPEATPAEMAASSARTPRSSTGSPASTDGTTSES